MKTFKECVIVIWVGLCLYFCFAFIANNKDPRQWHSIWRFGYILSLFLFFIFNERNTKSND